MFKDKLLKFNFFQVKNKETNNKQKIENLVVFLILLIITVIAINTIWGEDKQKNSQENINSSYTQLAENINNNLESNNEQFLEYNLEENLERILSKITGVGKVEVLITYSETSEVVAMYNETYTANNTEETDTNGGIRKIEQTDTNKEIIYEEKNGEKTPITRKSDYAKNRRSCYYSRRRKKCRNKNKYNTSSSCCYRAFYI